MERKITDLLVKWKHDSKRLPLLVHGARQVGKTFVLQQFGVNNYENVVYINFEQKPGYKSIFDGDLDPERIINLLETSVEKTITENTLIIFDEIQACQRALTSLKYFCEGDKKYHIAALGSLLGVVLNREKFSFPVGKVQLETLHPLDFEEFLWALGKNSLINEIKISFNSNKELVAVLHEQALELFKIYLCTGGMPAVINNYVEHKKLNNISDVQNNILNAYIVDMAKYATASESVKIRSAFDSIPAQLAKENKKFQYKMIKNGASATHFGVAIDWLASSGIINKCKRINHGKIPLSAFVDLSAFKLYMADTGLLTAKSSIPINSIIAPQNNFSDFKGALIENYVAQVLSANRYELFYWESSYQAEVDFVINSKEGEIIPVEVKSSAHTRSKSLAVYVEKYKPPYSIRISEKNFGYTNNIKSVPLYAAFCI